MRRLYKKQFEWRTKGLGFEGKKHLWDKSIYIGFSLFIFRGFHGGSDGKDSTYNAGDPGSVPWLGRSPGERNGYPLQYSCLENFYGQRNLVGYSPWCCRVRHNRVTNTFTFHFRVLEMQILGPYSRSIQSETMKSLLLISPYGNFEAC